MALRTDVKVDPSRILAALEARMRKYAQPKTVEVTYSAPYAVFVHEDLTARHPHGGSAKFLETPARQHRDQMARIISGALVRGRTLDQALLEAGQFLLARSQEIVPVDTGLLKASGSVRII